MPQLILGIVGDIAAGKGILSKYLCEKHQATSYRFSTVLRDVAKRLGKEESRENLQKISQGLREYLGQDILSQALVHDIAHDRNSFIIIEGIRRASDMACLQKLPGFRTVYLTADPEIRWRRLVERNENSGDANKTFEDFTRDEETEVDQNTKIVGREAEFIIVNNGSIEELYDQIEKVLKKLSDIS